MNFKNLLVEKKDTIAIVTVNRPDKLNALNGETLEELRDLFESLQDDNSVNVIIITGAGEKAFVAGADISELNKLDETTAKDFVEKGQSVFDLIENLGKPVIAAVNGFALGGGCELALACHIRIASERAKFGQPEVNLGIIPGYGGTQRLSRLINTGRAIEIILSGDMISAEEALKYGLINRISRHEELLGDAVELAKKICSKGQIAVRSALKAIVATNYLHLNDGLKLESDLFAECCATEDFKEGTSAFLEKRKPNFKNK
ncbi:enoyl-CoA hydratase-related protein [Melioribacteraceae bacterium 4301-Me]|uniref:enoyl-CoA hydratase-related protein n=1 Tax=Pyranulibacter aquaticus TaxID=3163344 RepID=UPI00359B8B7F